ncbi:hypothetical protein H9651_02390 [Microbacterium sp. Sa4CUA7]|uniref:Phthiocerol/phthiodiolone dimycocerosyl transferase n=1 Tax=Microbacterium pullorum TaxID=2762236 RepID=A0ABR8RZ11_9MICO|nr:hypothetical protein [Microbacterium pullorum]MBD7956482.1 hypothetical protein [Microbacterium pullorum]
MNTSRTPDALRPLGGFERIIDLYISRNPVQFSLAVELASPVSPEQLEQALAELQALHPLLMVRIDRDGDRAVFRRIHAPIPVRHVRDSDWQTEAATEQTRPIDPMSGPLARATLITEGGPTRAPFVLLTFSHQISDGRGALLAVHDLLALLAGRTRRARTMPDAQEDHLQRLPAAPPPAAGDQPADQVTPEHAALRPFDATPPSIDGAELDEPTTGHLRAAARENGSTVQGVLCAAAALELRDVMASTQIRINVPIDLRPLLGLDDAVVNRFVATTVTLRAAADDDLWSLARSASAQLRSARDRAAESIAMLASLHPGDAAEAEAAILAATAADLEITNLGVSRDDGSDAPAIWGPTMTTQVVGERILGVLTHAGRLRLTLTTHEQIGTLVTGIARRMTSAI